MQFFRNMPKDMESAASIDGSGAWGTFLKIMAPNAIPTFLTVFLFSLVWHWNDYFISSMFLPKNQTIMVKLVDVGLRTNLAGGNMDQRYLQAAMAVLAITPLVIVFGFAQKYFVESMDRAGIKG
jgi:multiple sugar transport system permease protein